MSRSFSSFVSAFLTGLFLALAVSGGIVGERLSEGRIDVAVVVNALVTSMSVVALVVTSRRQGVPCATFASSQAFGAVVGIALVHGLLRRSGLAMPWLSERPAQLVNDIVATFGVLALVVGMAKGADLRILFGSLALATVYRATAGTWHLNHAPHGFEITVQQLVVAQLVAVALAMVVFRALTPAREA